MGQQVFDKFQQTIVDELGSYKGAETAEQPENPENDEPKNPSDSDSPKSESEDPIESGAESNPSSNDPIGSSKQGRLILDATVVDQAIRYPTDLSLLNEAREFSEQIIDCLYGQTTLTKKPRTYRVKARRQYLAVAKRRRAGARVIRKAIKQQLQYLGRNLGHIEQLLTHFSEGASLPLPNWLLRRFWVIPHLYAQQLQMHETKIHRCDDRIVSISQPWVRPIVRGKQHKSTEFGAKINVSLDADGLARIDRHSWDAFHEGKDLPEQVQSYYERYGHYPEVVIADNIYGTRSNRAYLKEKGIRFAGKPLGRAPKESAENVEQRKADKKQREKEYRQRIPIEGKFGQGKGAYRMSYIRAKRSDTSISWVNGIFFVMNLLVLFEWYFLALILTLKRLSTHRLGWRSVCRATVRYHRRMLSRMEPPAQVAV